MAARRLISGAQQQTCAVVGNAPSILMHKLGREIDGHDVVFRFNFAPTRGYERHVGRRTTVRVMGRSWVWNESAEQGGGDGGGGGGGGGGGTTLPLALHRYNNPTCELGGIPPTLIRHHSLWAP